MAHDVRAVAPDGLHALVAQARVDMRREPVADPGLAALLGEAGLAAYAIPLQGEEELGITAQEPFVIAVKIDADTMFTAQAIAEDAMLGHDLLQQPCFIAATVVDPAFDGEMGRHLLAGPQAHKIGIRSPVIAVAEPLGCLQAQSGIVIKLPAQRGPDPKLEGLVALPRMIFDRLSTQLSAGQRSGVGGMRVVLADTPSAAEPCHQA